MNELNYQIDLLKAMNEKLCNSEKMYQLVCGSSANAFIYYSFNRKEIILLGKWKDYFDVNIQDVKDLNKLYKMVDEPYVMSLSDILFLEKNDQTEASIECMLRDKKKWYEFKTKVNYDEEGIPQDKIISISNITKFKSQNEELVYMAYYDPLTGLYNRNYFIRILGDWVRRAKDEQEIVSVLVIDIDDFRKINDSLGMIVGDELIQAFGNILKEMNNDNVITCHLNSDIFCMAIYQPFGIRSVANIYRNLLDRLQIPFYLSGGQVLKITLSIGVAEFPESASSALELINCAEIIMHKGKASGKNRIQYFESLVLNDFLQNIKIENDLKEAIFHNNFLLYYQPQFFSDTGKLRGVEALIRWKDKQAQMISPAVFIPIAEKNGAIIPIGKWVVEQSIRQQSEWKKNYSTALIMSINISAIQFMQLDFVSELLQLLNQYQVEAREVELEITESVLIEEFENVTEKLRQLRSYGIRVSLDDFGTGFSSLSYLKKLPIDTLKIDKSFIDTLLTDSTTRIITESIINMVKTLDIESVAEGVEAEEQYKYLKSMGCDVIQGFYTGKPVTADMIETINFQS